MALPSQSRFMAYFATEKNLCSGLLFSGMARGDRVLIDVDSLHIPRFVLLSDVTFRDRLPFFFWVRVS
jgi:hypothetical protein